MRKNLMDREHLAHSGIIKMQNSIKAKYFWPGMEANVKRVVEACKPCQLHSRAQRREPHRPALDYMSRPMQAVGIDFFKRHGSKYLLLMDHFSGMPMYCIQLDFTTPYNPESSWAAERWVGVIKTVMKKIEEDGTCFEEALAVFRNTRNESSYSPNQLFFLRNWQDHNLLDMLAEPLVEEMEKA